MLMPFACDVIRTRKYVFFWMLNASVYLINSCWHEFQGFCGNNHLWAYNHVDWCVLHDEFKELFMYMNGDCLYYLFDKLFFIWISRLLRNHFISEPIITEMLIAYWRFQNRDISICLNVYGLYLCLKMLLTRNSKVLFKQTYISLKWCWYLLHNDVIKIRKIVFVWTLLVFI